MAPSMAAEELGKKENSKVWENSQEKFTSKRSSEYYDPCQEAANRSLKCMNRNNGDKDMCQDYFQAYRDCKKEWIERRREAKKAAGGGWFS